MRSIFLLVCVAGLLLAGRSSEPEATPTEATVAPSFAKKLTAGTDYEIVGTLPGGVDGAQALWFGADDVGTAYGELIVHDLKAGPFLDGVTYAEIRDGWVPVVKGFQLIRLR